MMEKDTLIEHLTFALKEILLKNLQGLDRSSMELNIERFMDQVVSAMTSEEILEKFESPENSLLLFMDYLAESGALDEAVDHTVH